MCNLYSNTMPQDAMRALFAVDAANDHLGNAEPLTAIFPKDTAPIVAIGKDDARQLRTAHWGFVLPQRSKRTGQPVEPKTINSVPDDRFRTTGFWQMAFECRRCLIPATSFCKTNGRAPTTYYWFGLSGDGPRQPFAFAGLFSYFKGPYGKKMWDGLTSTIVTTTTNELVRPVHSDRMPVILRPESYETWLTGDPDEAFDLIEPFAAEDMLVHQSGEGLKSDHGGI
ncbi:MAG: SOS response-associated peptidase family protein [Pseudomonadota bacterium]